MVSLAGGMLERRSLQRAVLAVSPAAGQAGGAEVLRAAALLAALCGAGFILYFRHADLN